MVLFAAAVLAAAPLMAPLRLDDFSVRAPASLRRVHDDFVRGSAALAVGSQGRSRSAVLALVDGDGADALSLVFSQVDTSLELHPGARDEWALAVTRFFREDPSLAFTLEHIELLQGAEPRLEAQGTLREGSAIRHVLLAAYPGAGRHLVAVVSAPPTRWASVEADVAATLGSVRLEHPVPTGPRTAAWAALAAASALLVASVGLWRRRLTRR